MAYAKWRDETFAGLSRMGYTYDAICRLLSAATTLHRLAEVGCSVEVSARETARMERRERSAEARVRGAPATAAGTE